MYHVELRQFPHNFCRFNLTERELRETILDAWAHGEWVEQGERKWSPHQASLTVLEGPEMPVEQLSMGRGWANARRHGTDVTEAMIAAARDAVGRPMSSEPSLSTDTTDRQLAGDSLAPELLAALGDDPVPLVRAWQLALERHPDRTPSECLALAEDLVRR
jgi:hypothetical protein